jgi:hypothetical protein
MAVPVPSVEQARTKRQTLEARLALRRPDLAPVLQLMSLGALLKVAEREGLDTSWWRY